MRLERIQEYVLTAVVIGGGLFLALFVGGSSARGQMGTIAGLLGLMAATVFLLVLREKVWLLLPVFWTLTGKIMILPLPFSVRNLVTLYCFGSILLLKALKIVKRKPAFTRLDIWILLALGYLVTVFMRNPVGVDALGSDRVGGRPYVEVLLAGTTYWVLSRMVTTPREALFLPILSVFGAAMDFVLNWIAQHFPSTAPILSQLYSGVATDADEAAMTGFVDPEAGTQRETHMGALGLSLMVSGVSFWRPLTLLNPLNFFRFLLLVVATYSILVSGFRSLAFGAAMIFLLSSYLQRGLMEVVRIMAAAGPVLLLMVTMQGLVFELPRSAQRTLSFLPGRWDEAAKAEAKGSTEWRLEMWKQMLGSDKYIENHWLGDGFGFTKAQFANIKALSNNPYAGSTADQQENFMIMGQVHSGPISAIRYVGIIGLIIHTGLLIVLAREAWRLAVRAKGSRYYTLTLFVGLPVIWEPINYWLLFGGYESSLPQAIFAAGMLKMLSNTLETMPAPAVEPRIAAPRPIHARPPEFAPTARRRPA